MRSRTHPRSLDNSLFDCQVISIARQPTIVIEHSCKCRRILNNIGRDGSIEHFWDDVPPWWFDKPAFFYFFVFLRDIHRFFLLHCLGRMRKCTYVNDFSSTYVEWLMRSIVRKIG